MQQINQDQVLSHDIAYRLRLLDVLDRITQVSLAGKNMEDVLSGVLDLVLDIFKADRAWFLYPCDPDATSWGVPMERTRLEWPGLSALGTDVPMSREVSDLFSTLRDANCAIQHAPDTGHPVPQFIAEQFSVKSQLMVALRPKIGKPWLFGLHHCTRVEMHDEEELQLFTSIAHRIADTLSVLLSNQQLRESEKRLQEQADIALQQSELHLKEAQFIAHVGSWGYNLATGRVTWTEELYRIFGISAETCTPSIEILINLIYPDDRTAMQAWIDSCASGQKPRALEFRCVRPDGTIRYIEGRGELLLDAEGKPIHLSGTGQDITERKQAEAMQLNLLRQLEDKELAKTRFLAAAGHDLRQPLTAAKLYLDTLKLTGPSAQQDKIIQRLGQSMAVFNTLLDSLLNISRLDSGTINPEYTLVNAAELINWIEQIFAPMASEKSLGFRLYFPIRKMLVVRSDVGLVKSVLMNLVSNAVKFTSNGAILISVRQRGSDALFQVWDTGIGIPGDQTGRIFDEFYQVNNRQRDRAAGLGLGLSIAKRSIALLGGEITCRSQVGRGSVFEFSLPLADTSGVAVQPVIAQENLVNWSIVQGKRFVVVEDDTLVAHAISHFLEGMGGEVRCFHNAGDALHHVNIGHADYFIVDCMLGGTLNGIQFLNLLRQKLDKPIRAVLVTGDTSAALIRVTANFDWPVLHKPVNMANLISSLGAQMQFPG